MKRYSLAIVIILCIAGTASQTNTAIAQNSITVPVPLTVGIDDVGWKRGWSTDANGGPWRLGLPEGRWMVLEDYEAVADVGKKVGTRLLCLFVMCEFDRNNICAFYPTTTQEGKLWDNSALADDNDFTIMNYVKDNAAYIEFGLHGVAHDYWENGVKSKGEFASCDYKRGHKVRPYSETQRHLECFKKLIDQYGISFPKSFVAPHYCYYYNPLDPNDTGGLMSRWGIKYGSQSRKTYLTDNGLMVLPRTITAGDGDKWNATSFMPSKIPDANYCYVESHWANFVEANPANNHFAAEKWTEWLDGIKKMPDRYVPKNTAQLFSQYLYKKYSGFTIDANGVTIDNSGMPGWAYDRDFLGNLVLKVSLKQGEHVSSAQLNGHDIACYYEDAGYGYIVLPRLDNSQYLLVYSTDTSEMPSYVKNKGTYNVINFAVEKDKATISLEMYGTQDVMVKLDGFAFAEAKSDTKDLKINSSKWDKQTHTLVMNITASDAQGSEGGITITASD